MAKGGVPEKGSSFNLTGESVFFKPPVIIYSKRKGSLLDQEKLKN